MRNDAGEYLLHLRDHIPGIWEPGMWSLLGGGREPADRSLEETVRRELLEEAGLHIPVLMPFGVEYAKSSDGATVPIQIFAGHWSGDPAGLELTEGVMLHWFRPGIMPCLRMSPSTLDVVLRHAETCAADANRPEDSGTLSGRTSAPESRPPAAPLLPASSPGGGAVLNVVGVHLYLERDDGRILLGLRHPDSAYAGSTWHFLAGHCEQESAVACLIREAKEEAGLLIRPEDVDLVHTVHLVDTHGGQPRMQMVFRARKWRGEPEILEPDKCTAWQWWEPDALPSRTVPYARAAVAGIGVGRRYTEVGWS
ncbi:NUDIX hydrolase [Streptomyces bathyalis]|uniref:NUDIX hydrolase n=1 Tax=Streptomyces bathyalis TaxID=2710756 RepID=UPI001FEBA4FB|nr:NUDIX domain-containing protein [Streptomyces bathyalis]